MRNALKRISTIIIIFGVVILFVCVLLGLSELFEVIVSKMNF